MTFHVKLTISTHCLSQLHGHGLFSEILLIAGLDLDGISPDYLLDLSALEAHLRLTHDLGLRPCILSVLTALRQVLALA